ncbi:DUF932 domain-containing protein [Vibrio fluvialis]|uniref:DUF932 domain-containing protein n=1 Tax=Vibrio fluvialis TaxID=676 RepID=UPI0023A96684|nr:DUF932 domain-containing protein [Vibrio fluvialis]MDE5179221.1 DUF932 domain-containing protein [Vibrio fluvialis]
MTISASNVLTTALPFLSTNRLVNPNSFATETTWRGILDNRTNQDIFFPVSSSPLEKHLGGSPMHGLVTNGEQVIVDESVNPCRIIAVHGKQYHLTTNEEAFTMVNYALSDLLEKGLLNSEGMYVTDALVKRGGKVIRQYILPNESVTLANGDVTHLRLVVINSYDGSCNFSVQAGGFRVVCTNGQVVGQKFLNLQKRHTSGIQLEHVQQRVIASAKSFSEMGEYWKALIETPVTQKVVEYSLAELCANSEGTNMNKFLFLTDLYKEHAKDLGANFWALYNTMTSYATHYEVPERSIGNLAQIQLDRQQDVSKVLKSKAWSVIEHA